MSTLPINYCVICGTHSAPCLFLCAYCVSQGEKLPGSYNPDQTYHCTFCGKKLDAHYDFEKDTENSPTFFKSKDYLCLACDFASEQQPHKDKFQDTEYLPRAVTYIEECLLNRGLPAHIRYNYEQHQKYFKSKIKQ